MGHIEAFTSQLQTVVETVKGSAEGLEGGRVGKVERLTKNIDEDLEDFCEDLEALQLTSDKIDNSLQRNDIKFRGLKDDVKGGEDLKGYLTDLFIAWAGSECDIVISIVSAYRIRVQKETNKHPTEVLI